MQRNNKISKRTIYDRNNIVIFDSYAEIIIRNVKGKEIARTLIDIEDIDKVKDIKWCMKDSRYIISGNNIRLNRIILNCPLGYEVDHINHDTLDNRRRNLRIVTRSQNSMNRGVCRTNISGHKGVSWNKKHKKWVAQICINYKTINLGYFDNIEDAIAARKSCRGKVFRGICL